MSRKAYPMLVEVPEQKLGGQRDGLNRVHLCQWFFEVFTVMEHFVHMGLVVVTFHVAVTKYQTKPAQQRGVSLGSPFEGKLHRGTQVMVMRATLPVMGETGSIW